MRHSLLDRNAPSRSSDLDKDDGDTMLISDPQLRVRFTTRKWAPAIGGMETYSVRLAEELKRLCDLETVALPGRPDGRAPSGLTLLVFGLATILRLPFRRRVDVAHLGDMAIWPIGLLEILLGKARALTLSAHGSDVSFAIRPGWRARLYRSYLELGARLLSSATVIANSSYVANLARLGGYRHVTIVPLGTDLLPAMPTERLGLLFVGRITPSKGLRFLVEQVLPRLDRQVVLKVAGTVWDDEERSLFDHPQVEYLGALKPDALAGLYTRSQIALIPSQVPEGFGLVAIEAAACGCAVIASRSGGLVDIVAEPWGDLVDVADTSAWATAISNRLGLPSGEVARNNAAAISDVDRQYRWPRVAEQSLEVMKAALPSGGNGKTTVKTG